MADNTSVGQIALDMTVNRNGFDRSLNKITDIAKKAGAAIAAAFAINKLVDFGKSCLDLGSDLSEVQNVVDVTFQTMSDKVNKFAQSAKAKFGLSETMAKKFTGTFGSMADAFGFPEEEAYKMSTALTGLAGDVASFYNISQDMAYTKLKSVFSGETEALKDLGVVMTQSALDAYALANGYGKTTAKMSEAEKVSLRFAFVQEKLSNASGDFARTSGGWANQVRILALGFDSLKASIGQGLINVFTPVIKWMNVLIEKINVAATKFKEFTELITGKKTESSSGTKSVSETADSMSSAADSAASTADSTSKTAKNLKKASKFLAGFDKITKMDSQDTSSDNSGSSSGANATGTGIKKKDSKDGEGEDDEDYLDNLKEKFNAIIQLADKMRKNFSKGFKIGLGDTSVLDSIKNNMKSIRKSMQEIVYDKAVQAAFGNMFLSLAESTGKIAGSFASIGLAIADNLTGGISKYLEQNTGRIKNYLIRMFDITAETTKIRAGFMAAIADIFTVFRSNDAKQITADCIKIFSDAFMGVTELLGKSGRNIWKSFAQPFVDNKDVIKKYISDFISSIQPVMNFIAKSLESAFDSIQHIYDNVSSIIIPFAKWFISTLIPIVLNAVSDILKAYMGLCKGVSKAIKGICKIFEGFSDIVAGVLVGDMKKASSGVKKIFKGLKGYLEGKIEALANIIRNVFTRIAHAIAAPLKLVKATFEKFATDCWEGFSKGIDGAISGIFDWVHKHIFQPIKKAFCSLFGIHSPSKVFQEWGKYCIDGFLKGLKKNIKNVLQWFKELPEKLKKKLGNLKDKFIKKGKEIITGLKGGAVNQWKSAKQWFKSLPESAVKLLGNIKEKFSKKGKESINGIKNGASETWKTAKQFFIEFPDKAMSAIGNIKEKAKKKGEEIINGIQKGFTAKSLKDVLTNTFKTALNAVIDILNTAIDKINEKLTFTIKDVKLPGGKKIKGTTINLGKLDRIKHLAQGGYVKANTPQLAMIGDNRHQGEVVAPEGKLYEVMTQVLKDFTKQNRSQGSSIQQDRDINLNLELVLGEQKFRSEVIKAVNKDKRLNGRNSIKFT